MSKTRLLLAQREGRVCLTCLFRAVGGITKLEREAKRTNLVNDVSHGPERVSDLFEFTRSCKANFRAFPVPVCSPWIFVHFSMQGAEGGRARSPRGSRSGGTQRGVGVYEDVPAHRAAARELGTWED